MASTLIYIALLITELFIIIFFTFYVLSLLYSSLYGAPFVPSKKGDVDETLKAIGPKKNQIFLELGSGDGRVVMEAVKKYAVFGYGIEISPLLVWYSRLIAKINKIKNIEFKRENIYHTDLSKADIIYIFLMPKMVTKLLGKLEKGTKKGALIVSHGFTIPGWEKFLKKKLERKVFSSYFYQR